MNFNRGNIKEKSANMFLIFWILIQFYCFDEICNVKSCSNFLPHLGLTQNNYPKMKGHAIFINVSFFLHGLGF